MPLGSPHGRKAEAWTPIRIGRNGAVVANHPLAAQAGMQVLLRGGNAVDAAVAVGFAIGVAEPQGSGLGGDGFMLIAMRGSGRVELANGTGTAPAAATASAYRDGIAKTGPRAASVPGIVDGLCLAHARHGRLPLAEVLAPAIALAEEGVPVSPYQAALAAKYPALAKGDAGPIHAPAGAWLAVGALRRNPGVARCLKEIAAGGRDAFYLGWAAEEIVRACAAAGGILSREDFRRQRAFWQAPISTSYRGRTVYEAPPSSSGIVLLQELNLIERFEIGGLPYLCDAAIHLMAEAKRLAFIDREAFIGDPDLVEMPVAGLLSKEYADARAQLIDPERAAATVSPGKPWDFQEPPRDPARAARWAGERLRVNQKAADTTHWCVIDREGNAVDALSSINMTFGAQFVAGATGILMNDRMTYWHLDPAHPNYLRPGARVRHTMNPVMLFDAPAEQGGRPICTLGTPGGDTQVQTNMQIISAMLDHGLDPAEAVHAPRWTHYQDGAYSNWPHQDANEITIEERAGAELVAGLARRGHAARSVPPWDGRGSAGVIQVLADGTLAAAADPRRDGTALVW
ncbi:MAG: gamma-glutamyltransferase [Alphaproteobacteria bacterium]|nr:gamma-glutamyltransferase [Alphaproteobacteria bacterium]